MVSEHRHSTSSLRAGYTLCFVKHNLPGSLIHRLSLSSSKRCNGCRARHRKSKKKTSKKQQKECEVQRIEPKQDMHACRAIYEQSYEEIVWQVSDNNGMPKDPNAPLSDLAQSIAHDDPNHPSSTPSPIPSSPSSTGSSSANQQQGSSQHVQSGIRQAAQMDSVQEGEQAQKGNRWQEPPPLQTIALDDDDLPLPTSGPPAPQVRLLHTRSISNSTFDVA